MKLSTIDINYINHRMDMYDIKYQEIYDEIKDHMVSAIETARAGGDERNIVYVFDELMEAHFPGFWALQKISKQYEKAYRQKIRRVLWANIKNYINTEAILGSIILIGISFYLPRTKTTSIIFFICLTVIAFIPVFYAWLKSPKMNLKEGKQSLIKNQVTLRASLLTTILQLLLNGMNLIADEWNLTFLKPAHFSPVFLMTLLCLFIIYSLSVARLCRQEFKLAG